MTIKCIVLVDGTNIICKLEEISADIGQPNCKIMDAYQILDDGKLDKWLKFSDQNTAKLRSENILTIVEPNTEILKSYMGVL